MSEFTVSEYVSRSKLALTVAFEFRVTVVSPETGFRISTIPFTTVHLTNL
jgi:hypothetical protein